MPLPPGKKAPAGACDGSAQTDCGQTSRRRHDLSTTAHLVTLPRIWSPVRTSDLVTHPHILSDPKMATAMRGTMNHDKVRLTKSLL